MTALILHFPGRPPTHNAKRYEHWSKQGLVTKQYRLEARLRAANKPKFTGPVIVNAQPFCRDNRLADAGACFDVVKAIIDGIVDAGLLPGDGPQWVKRYELCAPENTGDDVLVIEVRDA